MSVEMFTSDIDRLYDVINSMHKSLQCTICLELMTESVKTRCGHSFCKLCIAEVLKKRQSSCPLCNKKLDRRNISKDDHLQLCRKKFTALISAIKADSHIDILSHLKQPRDTKESCSNSDVSYSNKNSNDKTHSHKAQSAHQSSDRQIDKPSTSRETINCDNHQQYNSNMSDERSISNAFGKAGFTDERNANMPEAKVRTWLHMLPDELNANLMYGVNEDGKVSVKSDITLTDQSEDDNKSDATSHTRKKMSKSRKTSKKQRARQSGKVKTIDLRATGKLKYARIHAKVRARESQKKDAIKPVFEETNNQQNSISTTVAIEERDHPSLDAASTSSANWSGVLEFGKEIRAKKKRIKKLNVSTEKNKKLPQIMENIKLTQNSQYDLSRIVPSCDTSQANEVSNLPKESHDREQDAADKSPNMSNAKAPLRASGETDACNEDVSFTKSRDISSTNLPMETSCIMLEEGEKVHIMHLNNDQVNQIIGIENSKSDSQHVENRYCEENAESNVCPDLSQSPWKKRQLLTPEKLNESTAERERIFNAAQVSIKNSKNLPDLTIGDRISGVRESSVKKTSEVFSQSPLSGRLSLKRKPEVFNDQNINSPPLSKTSLVDRLSLSRCENEEIPQSPFSGRLSLKKKPEVCSNQNMNSPPLSKCSLVDRLSLNRHEIDVDDCRNVGLKDKIQSARMAAVRRHLNLDVDNIGSAAQRSIKKQGHKIPVKFMQLGALVRRSNVRLFYMGATKRERTLKAKVEVHTVCNMQQSISRQEMEWQVAKTCGLAASPDLSSDSQSLSNITVVENLHFANNLNANPAAIPENANFSTATTTCKVVSTTLTPEMDIDRDLSRKTVAAAERFSMKPSKRSTGSVDDAEEGSSRSLDETLRADSRAIRKKTSRAHLISINSVKLLSPDKDSQLKFLAIDSPTSRSEDFKASSISRQQAAIKESNIAASTRSTTRRSFRENSNKKRKRTRHAEALYDDWQSDDSNILSEGHTKLNKCSRSFHDAKSDLDANKKRRLSLSSDQDVQVISSDSEKQDGSRKTIRKIMSIPNSDIAFEVTWKAKLTANVAGESHKTNQSDKQNALTGNTSKKKCLLEQNSDDILLNVDEWEPIATLKTKEDKNLLDRNESTRCPSVGKPASHQSSCSTNALETEKRKNTRSSEKSFTTKESDEFESNSIFHSDNVDLMLQQMMGLNSDKTSGKITNPNDDIINQVLWIDQPRDNPDACRPPSSAARNGRTSRSKKNSGDYLLEDNFDETIANVDLPQSEDMMSCGEQPTRSHTIRTLTEQNTPNCLAMTDESRGITQEAPTSLSSTNDIFEHSSRSVRKLSMRNASENFDKENTISHVKKRDSMDDRGNKKSATAKHLVDTVDRNFQREITVEHNVSCEKEKSFNRAESIQRDKEHNASTNSVSQLDDDFGNNTLMNVTQEQACLRIIEKDLFSSPTARKKTPKIACQDVSGRRKEQCTPKRRKRNERDENTTAEERYAEEDDVVENTPERKRKSGESNITTESRRSTSYPSPITKLGERTPNTLFCKKSISKSGNSTFQMIPLDESTPKIARPSTVSKQSKENETILSGSILLPKQTDGKTSENIRQLADRQRLCFVCTSLSEVQVSFVIKLAATCNAKYVKQFDRDVTHVIVNTTGEQNVAKSTLKYLQGIAHRKWIVSYRWVEDCLKEKKLLDEVPYEATTYNDDADSIQGPRNSRLREKDLFEGFTFLCVKPYRNVSHSQYQDLLLATGATVVNSIEELAKKKGMKGVVIQEDTHDIETIENWYHTAKAAIIMVDWIVECIGHYKLLKLAPQYLSMDDFQAIGYPSELVEEYEEYSDDEN